MHQAGRHLMTDKYSFMIEYLVVFIVLVLCSFTTFHRNQIWKDEVSLWTDVAIKSPGEARPYNGLLIGFAHAGRFHEAVDAGREAIKLDPPFIRAHVNLSGVLGTLGIPDESVMHVEKALSLDPDNANAYHNLGVIYLNTGRYEDAIQASKQAVTFKPSPDAYCNLGVAYIRTDRHRDGIESFIKAIEVNPDFLKAYINLGTIYTELGRNEEAVEILEQALMRYPDNGEAREKLAVAKSRLNGN